jgi:hypothetical protein
MAKNRPADALARLFIAGGCSASANRSLLHTSLAHLLFLAAAWLGTGGCRPAQTATPSEPTDWHDFQGTWTAAGTRNIIRLGPERRASTANLTGSLVLAGASRPAIGFRAEAVVLNDSATGMLGRAVWTDEHGDQAYSELRGEGTATHNTITGTFVGGTGRYAGATGNYEFSWRFVLESEDGTVQGQSLGLKGRVRVANPEDPDSRAPRP